MRPLNIVSVMKRQSRGCEFLCMPFGNAKVAKLKRVNMIVCDEPVGVGVAARGAGDHWKSSESAKSHMDL